MPRCGRGRTLHGVDTVPEESLGIAIIRAWIERGPPRVLKVRVTTAPDVRAEPRTVGVTSNIEDACAFIRDWLEGMVAASANGEVRSTVGPRRTTQ
jgi:hypothetical protein